jgi:ribosome-binding factor A
VESGRRAKKVASLIKETLSRILIRDFQGAGAGLITVTRVEMTPDLQAAHVYLSFFGDIEACATLDLLEKRKGYIRKSIASEVKLKYNPTLIFSQDPTPEYQNRIDSLIERLKNGQERPDPKDQE